MSNKYDNAKKIYKPTWESLDGHKSPDWFNDAKFGIFIHWGVYSVPGYAPKVDPGELWEKVKAGQMRQEEASAMNPYAEWYWDNMKYKNGPTWKYHREHYGKDFKYDDFIPMFKAEKWNPEEWVNLFKEIGAKYVVLTSKHCDGFSLWPSKYNPRNAGDMGPHRDLVGDLTRAVRAQNLKMGLYYDYGWGPGGTESWARYQFPLKWDEVDYVHKLFEELVDRYNPDIYWDDSSAVSSDRFKSKELIAYYLNHAKDPAKVTINDRCGSDCRHKHGDFWTPEYKKKFTLVKHKWELCRGIGTSFGYNRIEGEKDYMSTGSLIKLLVDVVSKNGNLLLDIGPMADGTIPEIQVRRLRGIGDWLKVNNEAIYGASPWVTAEETTLEGINVRFTRKESNLYVMLLEKPEEKITLKLLQVQRGATIKVLGSDKKLKWEQKENNLIIELPSELPGAQVYTLKITPEPWKLVKSA